MQADGHGPAPSRYTVLLLGSGGRGESLLAMDQDNALVYEADGTPEALDPWFAEFAKRFSDILHDAGVPYCKGGVMASNPDWRKSSLDWRQTVDSWISRARPEDYLNCDIFFDGLCVHGDNTIAESLLGHARNSARTSHHFLKFLALNATPQDSAFGWLNQLKLTSGRIDIKMHGILPIFSAARVIALEHGIASRSTLARLEAVRELGVAPESTIQDLLDAHEFLLRLNVQQQLRDLDAGLALGNAVDPKQLSSLDRDRLRWALKQIQSVASLLGTPVIP